MSVSSKKKQDEEHLKILREMVALANNKHCFDCHQRGPTYLNMTIGSFVCTSCSGLLRGLNPPHRVKSISMASFTPDEMEFIKSRGNAFCQKVWLGMHDGRLPMGHDKRDESRMRDVMAQRYEKKRWYVQPTDAMYEEARRLNTESPQSVASRSSAIARPQPTAFDVQRSDVAASATSSQSVQRPSVTTSTPASLVMHASAAAPTAGVSRGITAPPGVQSSAPTKFDLLADFGGDPFVGPAKSTPASNTSDGFANFDAFTSKRSTGQVSMSANVGGPIPVSRSLPPVSADKYSALAELESAFSAPPAAPAASVNWDSSFASRTTQPSWGAPATGSMFGTGGPTTTAAASGLMYGGNVVPSAAAFASAPGVNPFGQTQAAPVSNPFLPAGQMYMVPPSGQQTAVGAGFSQPMQPMLGYNQFGNVAPASSGQFVPAAAATGHFNVPNGGVWATQPAVVGQVPAQYHTWAQPAAMPPNAAAAANPFVSGVPARSNTTNPFL